MGEQLKRSLRLVASKTDGRLRLELHPSEEQTQLGEAIASFDVSLRDSALLHSSAYQIGMAVLAASLAGEEVPDALAGDMEVASRLSEQVLRKRANESIDGQFLLALHLATEARMRRSLALLHEVDSILKDLLDKKHAPAAKWAQVTWPRLRELTIRIIGKDK
jgi:hypothetical protein